MKEAVGVEGVGGSWGVLAVQAGMCLRERIARPNRQPVSAQRGQWARRYSGLAAWLASQSKRVVKSCFVLFCFGREPGMTRKAKGTKESIGPGLGMISFELKSIHMFPCALAQGRNSGHHDRECKSKKGVYRFLNLFMNKFPIDLE